MTTTKPTSEAIEALARIIRDAGISGVQGDHVGPFDRARADAVLAAGYVDQAPIRALLASEIADLIESRVRAARGDVRCLDCNLRYDEREEYGCHWSGQAHSYDEGDLAAAEETERSGAVEYVTLSVADLRAALDPAPAVSVKTRIEWFDAAGARLGMAEVDGDVRCVRYDPEAGAWMPMAPEPPAGAAHVVTRLVVERP